MKKFVNLSIIVLLLVAAITTTAQTAKQPEIKTVASVDLSRYSGKWFEIAKYPNKFQKICVGNTTATYTIKTKGKIDVLNQCVKKDGSVSAAKAAGRVEDTTTNAKLKVRFAPGALSFLPFVWADYWIIDLDPNYEFAVVGEPNREYLWILSRQPEMTDTVYQSIVRRIEALGYVPTKIVKTPQNVEILKGGVISK